MRYVMANTPKQNARTDKQKDNIKLKPKTKAFADKLISNPKMSHARAYLETHQTNNMNTAGVEAHRTLRNPNVQIYLNKHIDKAKHRIVELIDSKKENIALQASDSVLDRALGKPTQQIQSTSKRINITLEGKLLDID